MIHPVPGPDEHLEGNVKTPRGTEFRGAFATMDGEGFEPPTPAV